MKYCFDTSALIDLGERYYPERLPVFAPIWGCLYKGIEKGEFLSVDAVREELDQKADDWRDSFFQRASKMFLIDEHIENEYGNLIGEIEVRKEFRDNTHRRRFLGGADPWVIALARSLGEDGVVVTAETKALSDYGMRPICDVLGLKNNNILEFLEANKIGF